MHQELIHTEEQEGFTIRFYACEEDSHPQDSFTDEEYCADVCKRIENGELVWFMAKVTASKAKVELASDYLGGCCYGSYKEFIKPGDYYDDMVNTVVQEARAKIKELAA